MRIDCVFYSTRGQVCVARSGTELPLRMTGADYYYYYLPVQRPVLSPAMLLVGQWKSAAWSSVGLAWYRKYRTFLGICGLTCGGAVELALSKRPRRYSNILKLHGNRSVSAGFYSILVQCGFVL